MRIHAGKALVTLDSALTIEAANQDYELRNTLPIQVELEILRNLTTETQFYHLLDHL